jgi:hypothetical protein
MSDSFHVFCGWDRRQAEGAEVFAYSVQRNSTIDLTINFVSASKLGLNRVGVTEFSYARFLVPWFCGYHGIAAFFDGCDQLCLGDIAELAAMPMDGYAVRVVKHTPIRRVPRSNRARSWSSVMLMDCAKLGWLTPDFVRTASDPVLMGFSHLGDDEIGDLSPEWNALVESPATEPPAGAKLAHWSYLSDPNGDSWIDRSGSQNWASWRARWREQCA